MFQPDPQTHPAPPRQKNHRPADYYPVNIKNQPRQIISLPAHRRMKTNPHKRHTNHRQQRPHRLSRNRSAELTPHNMSKRRGHSAGWTGITRPLQKTAPRQIKLLMTAVPSRRRLDLQRDHNQSQANPAHQSRRRPIPHRPTLSFTPALLNLSHNLHVINTLSKNHVSANPNCNTPTAPGQSMPAITLLQTRSVDETIPLRYYITWSKWFNRQEQMAEAMGHNTKGIRKWSASYSGWAVSVAVHLIIIALLAALSLRAVETPSPEREVPTSSLAKESNPLEVETFVENLQVEAPPEPPTLQEPQPTTPDTLADLPNLPATDAVIAATGPGTASAGTTTSIASLTVGSFCNISASGSCIAYVVDCSGSMIMAFDYVRSELLRSIGLLGADKFFTVIFYAAGEPIELEPGKLIRAGSANRLQAHDFVRNAKLRTVTDSQSAAQAVANALTAALTAQSRDGQTADLIYLLTDGQYEQQIIANSLAQLQNQRAKPAIVNVIACGNRDNEEFLRQIAQTYNGTFEFVSDEEMAQPPTRSQQ